MPDLEMHIRRLEPARVWKWSSALLWGALGVLLLATVLAAYLSLTAQIVVFACIAGSLLFGLLLRDELALLSAVLAGFVVAVRYEEGFQLEEVLYGLLYLSYLGYWYVSRLFFYRDSFLRTRIDWALFLFLVYAMLSLALTPILGGEMKAAISQWLSLSMLAFYFPIREICIRKSGRLPQKAILYSLGFVAVFVALRNFNDYRIGLSQAEYLFQIATGRVVMNEHVLLMAGITTLVFLLYARRWPARSLLTGLFLIFSAGVLIGQSRAVWVSYALGVGIIFFFVDRKRKLRIALLAVTAATGILVVGAIAFEDFFGLIVAGITSRFLSLQTAATQDISLINRFIEMGAVWEYVVLNPIVGHGFGVPYQYYSLVYEVTWVTSFVHNGYLGVWYRHGLIGAALLFTFYFGVIWLSFKAARAPRSTEIDRKVAIAAVAYLVGESLLCNTSNSFATSDITLIIATAAGLGAAASHHTDQISNEIGGR